MISRIVSASLAFLGHLVLVATILGVSCVIATGPSTSILRIDVVGVTCLGGLIAALEAFSQRGDDPTSTHRHDALLALATGFAVAIVMCSGPLTRSWMTTPHWSLSVLGALIALGGALLRARAIHVLGKAFVTDPQRSVDQIFVDTDVYRWVRHPSELGLYAICIGMALLSPSLATVIGTITVVALSALRLRREEAFLRESLGDAYRDYAGRVPAVVPIMP